MNPPAFYIEPELWEKDLILKDRELAHAKVLRLKQGDKIFLLDGIGKRALCQIEHMDKKQALLRLESVSSVSPPQSRSIVALALSKAVRRNFFMEKAAELGASEVWLWRATYSQGKLTETMASGLREQLVAGMKQSRNPWLPKLRILQDAVETAKEAECADYRLLPWEVTSGVPMLLPEQLGRLGVTIFVIGPEGGFAHEEIECFKNAGFVTVSLGHTVLRCETAAVLCLGLHWWASQLPGHPDYHAVEI